MKKDKSYLLLKEPHMYRAFLILAWPVMVSNVLKSFHDLVDTYFIGQLENSVAAQAGVSITWPLLNIFLSLSTGLSVAGVAIISQHLGAGNQEASSRKYPKKPPPSRRSDFGTRPPHSAPAHRRPAPGGSALRRPPSLFYHSRRLQSV